MRSNLILDFSASDGHKGHTEIRARAEWFSVVTCPWSSVGSEPPNEANDIDGPVRSQPRHAQQPVGGNYSTSR
jgi:hypothetical protein